MFFSDHPIGHVKSAITLQVMSSFKAHALIAGMVLRKKLPDTKLCLPGLQGTENNLF